MNFKEALKVMKSGAKVKLPSWGGYWYWDKTKDTIIMHTKDGDEIDIRDTQNDAYTLDNICSDEWMIANETNCTELGGEVTFGFDVALKYIKRGFNVRRKTWGKNVYVYLETQDVKIYEGKETLYISLAMRSVYEDKTIYDIGWRPCQSDLLSEDWCFCD